MLQHNMKQRAHLAHAAVVSVHAICCGMPVMAVVLTALFGTASAATVAGAWFAPAHAALHAYETWILVASAVLVATGAALEWLSRRSSARSGAPWLFGLSVAAFVVNVAVVASH